MIKTNLGFAICKYFIMTPFSSEKNYSNINLNTRTDVRTYLIQNPLAIFLMNFHQDFKNT